MQHETIIKSETAGNAKLTLTKHNKNDEWFRYLEYDGETYEMGFTSLKAAKARYNYDKEQYTNLSLMAGR
jgi:hypothetical protein